MAPDIPILLYTSACVSHCPVSCSMFFLVLCYRRIHKAAPLFALVEAPVGSERIAVKQTSTANKSWSLGVGIYRFFQLGQTAFVECNRCTTTGT